MATIALDLAKFRALFPAYASNVQYADLVIESYWDVATAYISDQNGGCYCGGFNLAQQTLALNYMTAHLICLSDMIAAGTSPAIVSAGSIDKVSVTLEPPPVTDQWSYWLNTTPYGTQLLALLSLVGVGGMYFGGRPEISAFRKAGGGY